jgi:hypothetical protein
MSKLIALAATVAISMASPHAFSQGTVRTWGNNSGGQLTVPPELNAAVEIAAGRYHSAAIRIGGAVIAWGWNGFGQCDVPGNLEPSARLAAGYDHTVSISLSGTVRAWGGNEHGQLNTPSDLGPCKEIAAGYQHSVAIRTDGRVRAWGRNLEGQCNVPSDLGGATAIAAGGNFWPGVGHTVAIRSSQTVRAWGANSHGQCAVPADLGPAISVAAGTVHTVVLRSDLSVRCFGAGATTGGSDNYGQSITPADLGPVTAIAAGGYNSYALQADGSVRGWGSPYSGQLSPPGDLGPSRAVSAGYGHVLALTHYLDCNQNGTSDAEELPGSDCNGNGLLDLCEAEVGAIEDCNANGLGDTCEKSLTVEVTSARLAPIGWLASQSWTVTNTVRAASTVTLRLNARGDFSGAQEYVRIRLGAAFDENALRSTNDCQSGQTASTATYTLLPEQFNSAIALDGTLEIVFEPSIAVDPNLCPGGTWIEATLSYEGARPPDCNANGMLDSCEIAARYSPDSNHNGVIDTCESLILPCSPDFDQDGEVNGADLGILLSAWGVAGQPGIDLNGDGYVNGADLGIMLSFWGTCQN